MKSLFKAVLLALVLGFSVTTSVVADTDITHSVTKESAKVYLISTFAILDKGDGTAAVKHGAYLIKADSPSKAFYAGRAALLEDAPPSQGWKNHDVNINDVPEASLADFLKK